MTRPTIFEFAGGDEAFIALAEAHHKRCLADPELSHPFENLENPDHVRRLGEYWAEVFGGPSRYSDGAGGHSAMLGLHAGYGIGEDLGERFVACFVQAVDDAGLPEEPAFRRSLRAYMEWAVREVLDYSPEGSVVPPRLPTPRWGWSGLERTID